MIEVENLTKTYGGLTAVDDISFRVDKGEVLGFLGPNGAGKSTTMKMITGFVKADAGRVSVCGFDVETASLQARRCIGYLPEGAPCYGDMRVKDYLFFIAGIRSLQGKEATQAVDKAIADMQLHDVLQQKIETLSKGFKRRVGFAQAILHDPEVLILDEPTDGLDPNQKHQVRELIRNLSKEKIVVISTHILEEVDAVCDRAMIIARGKIVVDDKPEVIAAKVKPSDLKEKDKRSDILPALNAVFRSLTEGDMQ